MTKHEPISGNITDLDDIKRQVAVLVFEYITTGERSHLSKEKETGDSTPPSFSAKQPDFGTPLTSETFGQAPTTTSRHEPPEAAAPTSETTAVPNDTVQPQDTESEPITEPSEPSDSDMPNDQPPTAEPAAPPTHGTDTTIPQPDEKAAPPQDRSQVPPPDFAAILKAVSPQELVTDPSPAPTATQATTAPTSETTPTSPDKAPKPGISRRKRVAQGLGFCAAAIFAVGGCIIGFNYSNDENQTPKPTIVEATALQKTIAQINNLLSAETLRGDAYQAPITVNANVTSKLLVSYMTTDKQWAPLTYVGEAEQVGLGFNVTDAFDGRLRSIASPEGTPLYSVTTNEAGEIIVRYERGQLVPTFDRDLTPSRAANGLGDEVTVDKIPFAWPAADQPLPVNDAARLDAMKADVEQAKALANLINEKESATSTDNTNDGLVQIVMAAGRIIVLRNVMSDPATVDSIANGFDSVVADHIIIAAEKSGFVIKKENITGNGTYPGLGADWREYFIGSKAPTGTENAKLQQFFQDVVSNKMLAFDANSVTIGKPTVVVNERKK